ncbi:MAG TPA: flagellin [Bryobacteraceae bacterium]|nr:flagellin [Bryobacteraceae bacterium]
MGITIQTNIASLIAQNNLRINNEFQTQTITALTSGYRINSSADDAAGLAIANQYRSNIAELTQGVRNGNDGVSSLQIIDGGLNNVSMMLDRMKTLATESASTTFSGNRATLDAEYQQLIGEITRQANDIGLAPGGKYNVATTVYIGGGNTQSNAQVSVDLSGSANRVDATSLGLSATNVNGSTGVVTMSNSSNLNTGGPFAAGGTENFVFHFGDGTSFTAVLNGGTSGLTGTQVITALNQQLSAYGITAAADPTSGALTFSGSTGFVVAAATASAGTSVITSATTQDNTTLYNFAGGALTTIATASQTLTFTPAGGSAINVTLTTGETAAQQTAAIQSALAGSGISAVNDGSNNLYFMSGNGFTLSRGSDSGTGGMANLAAGASASVTAPSAGASVTANALSAITAINTALQTLGNVQGKVGAGESKLQYAMNLANSQITSFSAAESRIRDADMAAEAANLTKAQVLEQASLAAMAQANAAPQAVLALLK